MPKSAMEAFKFLKKSLLSAPVLAYPDPKLPYHLMVDAALGSDGSPGGLGASLVQMNEKGIPKAIGFASRGLLKHEKNYSAYLLELQAAVFGVEKFNIYLKGRPFTLHTDHKPLERLSKVHTKTFNRLEQLMSEYDFKIAYKPGVDNAVPDFLSRNPVSAVDMPKKTMVEMQRGDELIQKIRRDMAEDSKDKSFLAIKDQLIERAGVLFHRDPGTGRKRIFAPKVIQKEIIQSAHNSLLGGHLGLFKSANRILEKYFWPSMERDVDKHIKSCVECQRTKPTKKFPMPELVPLEQPDHPNHRVHIDLFGPLIASDKGKKFVCVMTCAFSKYVELVALPNKEAATVAKAIMDTWVTRYSTPREIVTDNGKEFANQLMEELAKNLNFLHKKTSPYHPQCNASAEVFNRTMRRYLQAVIQPPYLDWEQFLPPLRICYNTSVSKATLATPFSLVFGMDANMPYFDFEPSLTYSETEAGDYIKRLHAARETAKEQNIEYRKTYKEYYDRKNKVKDGKLEKEEQIFVAISNRQKYKNAKLQPLYEGPFEVCRVVPPDVYYKKGKKVHVTHLSRVKKATLALEELQEDQFVRRDETASPADGEDLVVVQGQPQMVTVEESTGNGDEASQLLDYTFYQDQEAAAEASNRTADQTKLPDSPLPPTPAAWRGRGQQQSEEEDSDEEFHEAEEVVEVEQSRMDTGNKSHVYHQDVNLTTPAFGDVTMMEALDEIVTTPQGQRERSRSVKRTAGSPPQVPEAKRPETGDSRSLTRSEAARIGVEVPDLRYNWSPVGKESKCHHSRKNVDAVCAVGAVVFGGQGQSGGSIRDKSLPEAGSRARYHSYGGPGVGGGLVGDREGDQRDLRVHRASVGTEEEGEGTASQTTVQGAVPVPNDVVGRSDEPVPAKGRRRHRRKVKAKVKDEETFLSKLIFRFAFVTLVSSLVAGAAGFIFGSSHDPTQAQEQLLANQHHLVEVLRANEHRASIDHQALYNLTAEVNDIRTLMAVEDHKVQVGFLSLTAMMSVTEQATRVSSGLEMLVNTHRLSPALVNTRVVKKKLDRMAARAQKEGRRLSITAVHELFNCPVSFGSFRDGRLRVVVHVPLTDREGRFTLYEYVPVPFAVNKSMVEVVTDRQLIAVAEDEKRHFTMSKDELAHCQRFRGFWSCEEISVVNKETADSCLWALYKADSPMAMRTCQVNEMGDVARVWRISSNEVVFWQPMADTVKISCDGRVVKTKYFKGLRAVRLDKGCWAENANFQMMTPSVLYKETMVLEKAPVALNLSAFTHFGETVQGNGLSRTVHDPGFPEIPDPELPYPSLPSHPVMHWIGLVAAIVAVLVIGGVVMLSMRQRWMRSGVQQALEEMTKKSSA